MSQEILTDFLFWCSLINLGVLVYWFLAIAFAKDLIYRLHSTMFGISKEDFLRIHYCCIALYKLTVFFFAVIPYLVLKYIL